MRDEGFWHVRLHAVLSRLIHKVPKSVIPPGFSTGSRFDDEVAARMMSFHISHLERVQRMRELPGGEIEIMSVGDSRTCESCTALHKKRFPTSKPPELPNPQCTCDDGCRCTIVWRDD